MKGANRLDPANRYLRVRLGVALLERGAVDAGVHNLLAAVAPVGGATLGSARTLNSSLLCTPLDAGRHHDEAATAAATAAIEESLALTVALSEIGRVFLVQAGQAQPSTSGPRRQVLERVAYQHLQGAVEAHRVVLHSAVYQCATSLGNGTGMATGTAKGTERAAASLRGLLALQDSVRAATNRHVNRTVATSAFFAGLVAATEWGVRSNRLLDTYRRRVPRTSTKWSPLRHDDGGTMLFAPWNVPRRPMVTPTATPPRVTRATQPVAHAAFFLLNFLTSSLHPASDDGVTQVVTVVQPDAQAPAPLAHEESAVVPTPYGAHLQLGLLYWDLVQLLHQGFTSRAHVFLDLATWSNGLLPAPVTPPRTLSVQDSLDTRRVPYTLVDSVCVRHFVAAHRLRPESSFVLTKISEVLMFLGASTTPQVRTAFFSFCFLIHPPPPPPHTQCFSFLCGSFFSVVAE